jgi:outer membrane protein assembly factor BamB
VPARYTGDQPWTFPTGKGIFSTPVIDAGGSIYIGSADHFFYALHPDGSLKWQFKTGEIIDSAAALPAPQPGEPPAVVVPSGDGHLYCLDADSGVVRWTFDGNEALEEQFNNWFEGNVAVAPDGTLYAGNTNFRYYALSPHGELRWTYKTGSNAWSIAGMAPDGTLIWGSCDTFIHGVSRQGKRRWRQRTLGFIAASAAVGQDGTAYIGSFDSRLYALDAASGKVKWKFRTGDHIYASAALLEEEGETRMILVGSTDGALYALTPAGEERWRYDSGAPIRSSPVIGRAPAGETGWITYFGNGAGKLFALNTRDGSKRWAYDTTVRTPELADRNDLNGSPALGPTGVVIGGEHGRVCYVPYDYPLHQDDSRGSVDPEAELPREATGLFYVSPGGGLQLAPPAEIPAAAVLTFRLLIRREGKTIPARLNNAPFNRGKRRLRVVSDPALPFEIQISADGRYLHLVGEDFLPIGASVDLEISGDCFTGGLRMGNLTLGGRKLTSFQSTFQFQVRDPHPNPLAIRTSPRGVPCFEWTRLAVPLPTMLPSLNQIGFDYLSWLIGVIDIEEPDQHGRGRLLCWAIGARRDQHNRLVVDPASDFALPLSGRYQHNAFQLSNANFTLKITGIPIPFHTFQLRGAWDKDLRSLPGSTAFAATEVLSIPNFGPAMVLAGLANGVWRQLTAVGTFLTRPCPAESSAHLKPLNVEVISGRIKPPGGGKPGWVTVKLAVTTGTYPAAEHRGGLLLLDPEDGSVLPLDYHPLLKTTADEQGNLASISLTLPPDSQIPKRVKVIVLLDVYPLHQAVLEVPQRGK